MPKVSRATAPSHQPIPGVLDAYSHEIDGWTISMETHLTDLDAAFLFKGAPDDQCHAPHMGYVLKGKYGMRIVEGVEVFEADDAFIHRTRAHADYLRGVRGRCTRTEEANRELPVVMANLMKYLEEQGRNLAITVLRLTGHAPRALRPVDRRDPLAAVVHGLHRLPRHMSPGRTE